MIYNNNNEKLKKVCMLLSCNNINKIDKLASMHGYSRAYTINKILDKLKIEYFTKIL